MGPPYEVASRIKICYAYWFLVDTYHLYQIWGLYKSNTTAQNLGILDRKSIILEAGTFVQQIALGVVFSLAKLLKFRLVFPRNFSAKKKNVFGSIH